MWHTHVGIKVLKAGKVLMAQSFLSRAAPCRVKSQQPAQQMHCSLPRIAQVPAVQHPWVPPTMPIDSNMALSIPQMGFICKNSTLKISRASCKVKADSLLNKCTAASHAVPRCNTHLWVCHDVNWQRPGHLAVR